MLYSHALRYTCAPTVFDVPVAHAGLSDACVIVTWCMRCRPELTRILPDIFPCDGASSLWLWRILHDFSRSVWWLLSYNTHTRDVQPLGLASLRYVLTSLAGHVRWSGQRRWTVTVCKLSVDIHVACTCICVYVHLCVCAYLPHLIPLLRVHACEPLYGAQVRIRYALTFLCMCIRKSDHDWNFRPWW